MKKLKLKALELGAKEVLTRKQLKNVLGGAGSGSGSGSGGGNYPTCPPTSCDTFLNKCHDSAPYCLSTSCTDNSGVTHYYKSCSPTQQF